MQAIKVGGILGKKRILDVVSLSNGWFIVKTENKKSARDFKVRTVYQTSPKIRFYTPKHAHFVIDFFGKLCANKEKAMKVLEAIIEVWHGKPVKDVLNKYESLVHQLPGYSLEYILYGLNWILEQEDVNFTRRPQERQQEINEIFQKCKIESPPNRLGSQLAISLFCDVALGKHPVEAFIRANLDVQPVKKR
jgi:hypothetical protein